MRQEMMWFWDGIGISWMEHMQTIYTSL